MSKFDYSAELKDTTPYKKKSTGTGTKKSKHKHIYEPCILSYPDDWWEKEHLRRKRGPRTPIIATYCSVCGKIGSIKDRSRWYKPETVFTGNIQWTRSVLTEEGEREMNPKTRTLPYFEIDSPIIKIIKFVELEE
jgi:hypothetical protein